MTRIAIISDNPNINTGYGKIALNLAMNFIHSGNEVYSIGLQHRGAPVTYKYTDKVSNEQYDIPIHSGIVYENNNPLMIDKALSDIKPDILLMIRDPVTFVPQAFTQAFNLQKWKGKIKRYAYIPAMTPYTDKIVTSALLANTDYIFTYTEAARLHYMRHGIPYNLLQTVNLGVDLDTYRKRDPYIEMGKSKIFGFIGLNSDKRKMMMSLLIAFKQYLDIEPDAYLYIHNRIKGQYDILSTVDALRIKGHILMPNTKDNQWNPDAFMTEEEMAALYSSFTATVSMSAHEGFNMPFLESMACGTPAIGVDMPYYDWSKQINKVPSHLGETHVGLGWISNTSDFANTMHEVAKHPVKYKINREGISHLTWKNTADMILKGVNENE